MIKVFPLKIDRGFSLGHHSGSVSELKPIYVNPDKVTKLRIIENDCLDIYTPDFIYIKWTKIVWIERFKTEKVTIRRYLEITLECGSIIDIDMHKGILDYLEIER